VAVHGLAQRSRDVSQASAGGELRVDGDLAFAILMLDDGGAVSKAIRSCRAGSSAPVICSLGVVFTCETFVRLTAGAAVAVARAAGLARAEKATKSAATPAAGRKMAMGFN
jgi:hypothetical protein